MDCESFDGLYNLHNNRWTEVLVSEIFRRIYDKILAQKERIVLDLKVQLYSEGYGETNANKEICRLLQIKASTLSRLIYNIRMKYRQGIDIRVDNKLHPEIYRAKRRKYK